MKLTQQRQQLAQAFLEGSARPLERALYAYHFQGAPADGVLQQLAGFQNDDGGFGRALEADLRSPHSSAIATSVGLQILRDVRAGADQPAVQRAVRYLLDTYDAQRQRWPIVPAAVAAAPHAPWWEPDAELAPRFGEFMVNPRAEIVGHLYAYAELVPDGLLASLGPATVAYIEAQDDSLDMQDLHAALRLAECEQLPGELHARLVARLQRAMEATVARDPSTWNQYVVTPLSVVSSPASPFAASLQAELAANLDLLIEQQAADGSWAPAWSWGDSYPDAWPVARREWQGVLTLANLRTLRSFGRLE